MYDGGSAYDVLAPFFRSYSQTRAAYLDAIDRIVESRMPMDARSMLDVGAGDGVRAWRIAHVCRVPRLVLVEPDRAMADHCRALAGAEVWDVAAEDLPWGGQEFDAITCLWNVLGHVPGGRARLVALRKMGALLSRRGQIFLDVNNRYNAVAYGRVITLGRALYDRVCPAEANGDISYTWRVGGRLVRSRGHVFTPGEMKRLINDAGLRVNARHVVDYETGRQHRSVLRGQLFYVLSKA